MRRTLLALSALTCLVGSSMLATPATSQTTYGSCNSKIGTYCPYNTGVTYCEMLPGQYEPMVCWNNRWTLA